MMLSIKLQVINLLQRYQRMIKPHVGLRNMQTKFDKVWTYVS